MKKKEAKAERETVEAKAEAPAPQKPNPHIFDAKVIHTGKGAGLLVCPMMSEGAALFHVTHLGTAAALGVGIEGAKALKVLLDDWIEVQDATTWNAVTEWRIAT